MPATRVREWVPVRPPGGPGLGAGSGQDPWGAGAQWGEVSLPGGQRPGRHPAGGTRGPALAALTALGLHAGRPPAADRPPSPGPGPSRSLCACVTPGHRVWEPGWGPEHNARGGWGQRGASSCPSLCLGPAIGRGGSPGWGPGPRGMRCPPPVGLGSRCGHGGGGGAAAWSPPHGPHSRGPFRGNRADFRDPVPPGGRSPAGAGAVKIDAEPAVSGFGRRPFFNSSFFDKIFSQG